MLHGSGGLSNQTQDAGMSVRCRGPGDDATEITATQHHDAGHMSHRVLYSSFVILIQHCTVHCRIGN